MQQQEGRGGARRQRALSARRAGDGQQPTPRPLVGPLCTQGAEDDANPATTCIGSTAAPSVAATPSTSTACTPPPVVLTGVSVDAQQVLDEMSESVDDEYFLRMMDEESFGFHINSTLDIDEDVGLGSRGVDFTIAEDETVVKAWQAISLEAITGDEQNGSTYWNRIYDHFQRNNKSDIFRSKVSVTHRWQTISTSCSKWLSCLEKVERLNPSGANCQDKVNIAQQLYKGRPKKNGGKPGKAFALHHCWALLQQDEKWRTRDDEVPAKSKKSSSSYSLANDDHVGFDNSDDDDSDGRRSPTPSSAVPSTKRPHGRKTEKEKLKKGGDTSYKESVDNMMLSRKELAAERMEFNTSRWMELKEMEDRRAAAEERTAAAEERRVAAKEMAKSQSDCYGAVPKTDSIKWNKENTEWFYNFCLEEIGTGDMEVGYLSEEVCHMICQKFSKKGISCDEQQVRNKWEASKKFHNFWHNKVASVKDEMKDDKWWKKVLKTRIASLEYRQLKDGPPKDLDSLNRIFGYKETEKDMQNFQSLAQDVDCLKKQLFEGEVMHQNIVADLERKISLLSDKLEQHENEVQDLKKLVDVKDCQIHEAEELRRKMNEMIVELKGKMRVFIRVRPAKGSDGDHISYPEALELKGRGIEVKDIGKVKQYVFDKVFGPDAKQKQIFDEMSELIESSLDGHKVCIFAYGPTGSGKTHTMIGGSCNDSEGLIPRSLKKIFARIDSLQKLNYTVHVSAAEIYLKDLYDLLERGRCKIPDFNLIEIMVSDAATSIALLEEALQKRIVRETKMKRQSSRSHFIFRLKMSGFNEIGQSVQGFLIFVDLAGSERVQKSGAEGVSLQEAVAINHSLLMLTQTLCSIAKNEHPTFRNAKITHLLKPYLTGGPKTLMLVNISPEASSISETTLALQFAERTQVWKNGKTGHLGGLHSTSFLSPSKIVPQHIPEAQQKDKQFSVTSKVSRQERYQPIFSSVRKGFGTFSRISEIGKRNRQDDVAEGGNKRQKFTSK